MFQENKQELKREWICTTKDLLEGFGEFKPVILIFVEYTLHKKRSFPLRFSLGFLKDFCGFGHIYWRNPYWKTSFFVQCKFVKINWFCSSGAIVIASRYWFWLIKFINTLNLDEAWNCVVKRNNSFTEQKKNIFSLMGINKSTPGSHLSFNLHAPF